MDDRWWQLTLLRALERVSDGESWNEYERSRTLKALRTELSRVEHRLKRVGQLELIHEKEGN